MHRGNYIVFEGISGTGKETQGKLLVRHLKTRHQPAILLYHPSPELKTVLHAWRRSRKIDHLCELYLLLADRESMVRKTLEPALARGTWVISLRNWVSALVYQGKTTKERDRIRDAFSAFEPSPDLFFWFDMAPDRALTRINLRHAKTGEPIGTFESVKLLSQKRKTYADVLRHIPHTRIDASAGIDEIHEHILAAVASLPASGLH
ncbi:dTMP kinase [Patescibacteria group bacterium]|nr:dTMP kinase [Patescibacteria group bacterium]